jgi:hypothetical protein
VSPRAWIKTEHAGAKNGGGHWGSREEAKELSKVARRHADAAAIAEQDDDTDWSDPCQNGSCEDCLRAALLGRDE